MITKLEETHTLKPIFKEYLYYIRQFYEIAHFDPWCEGALKNLHLYATAEDRHIYILKETDGIIGFALVNQHLRFNTHGFAVADFYIQKDHERRGYGRALAEHVFARFPGTWEVAVTLKNKLALIFWEQVVSSYTQGKFLKKRNDAFGGYGFVFISEAG